LIIDHHLEHHIVDKKMNLTLPFFRRKLSHDVLPRRKPIQDFVYRWIVLSASEPPLDSDVTEKPFTVILIEDQFLYKNSWVKSFQNSIPQRYGMSFASLSFPGENRVNQILESLKTDLAHIPDSVLVARGPRSSWAAQLYLESLPLRGLVMVDPILFDRRGEIENEAIDAVQNSVSAHHRRADDFDEWCTFLEVAQDRELKLEPNSVPMLVMNSCKDLLAASKCVAQRHGDSQGPFGEVPVLEVDDSPEQHQADIIGEIDSWIDTIY
jgi:hypothetical protein